MDLRGTDIDPRQYSNFVSCDSTSNRLSAHLCTLLFSISNRKPQNHKDRHQHQHQHQQHHYQQLPHLCGHLRLRSRFYGFMYAILFTKFYYILLLSSLSTCLAIYPALVIASNHSTTARTVAVSADAAPAPALPSNTNKTFRLSNASRPEDYSNHVFNKTSTDTNTTTSVAKYLSTTTHASITTISTTHLTTARYPNNGHLPAISNYSIQGMPAVSSTVIVFDHLFNSTEDSRLSTQMEWELPSVQTVLVCIVLLLVILGTIVGNILVCIAVCMVRKLRRPCNYLLVSLALSDLCVAILVMPIALLYEVFEKWNFGTILCDIWVSFDVLCCTASILNLCAISVDRYLAITKPLEYGVKRTPRRMMLCVTLVWLAAACISLPPLLILGNEHVDENGEPTCAVCQNFAYQIYATLGSFYIPLAVMLFVYYQIFRAARRIVLEEKRAQTHLQHALNGRSAVTLSVDLATGGNSQQRHSSYDYPNCSSGLSTCQVTSGSSGGSGLLASLHHKKLRFQLAKEKKASTTLGIIMSAFTICWLPFFILALIRPFVEAESMHVPQSLSSLFLWLGYANSLLNPIIYATLNRDFRKPFQEILYFRCSSLNTMMRENYYQDQYGEPPSQRDILGEERQGARESFL